MAGVTVPVIPFAHQYLVTEAVEGVEPDLPQLRDPDNLVYFRPEVRGLVMGGYERNPATFGLDGIPADFNGKLLPPDWPRFEEISAGAVRRVPAMADAGVRQLINGPEGFTPDNEFILGESEVGGFFVAAGFSAHGIAGAGGLGRQVAHWILDGEPPLDLWAMDIRRFGAHYRSPSYTLARSFENYATYYDIHYPFEERQAGRPLRLSPTYPRLVELDCAFGEKSGWERPNWFDSNAPDGDEALRPRGWAGRHWSAAIGAEAMATRQAAALFDETSFSKIEIVGPGALAFLERLCDNRMDRSVGRITYTQMLNQRGGIECDFTVTRLAEDRFWIVTGTAFGNHDLGWIRRHAPTDGSVEVRDLTSARACLGLWGPAAREIVGSLTDDDLSNDAFPYMTARQISVAMCPCWRCASRTSASWAGSCTAPPSSASPCGTPCGRRGRPTTCGPEAIGPSTACGWRRATGCGPPTSRRRTRPTRPALASRCGWTSAAASSVRRPWRQPATRWTAGCAAWCWMIPWRWRWAMSRSGSVARWSVA